MVCARGFDTPPGFGERVIRNVDDLRRQLAETRKRGYGLAVEEGEPGIVAVAQAFRAFGAADAPVAGTISIAGPRVRMTDARIEALVPLLARTAQDITELWPLRVRQSGIRRDGEAPSAIPLPSASAP